MGIIKIIIIVVYLLSISKRYINCCVVKQSRSGGLGGIVWNFEDNSPASPLAQRITTFMSYKKYTETRNVVRGFGSDVDLFWVYIFTPFLSLRNIKEIKIQISEFFISEKQIQERIKKKFSKLECKNGNDLTISLNLKEYEEKLALARKNFISLSAKEKVETIFDYIHRHPKGKKMTHHEFESYLLRSEEAGFVAVSFTEYFVDVYNVVYPCKTYPYKIALIGIEKDDPCEIFIPYNTPFQGKKGFVEGVYLRDRKSKEIYLYKLF